MLGAGSSRHCGLILAEVRDFSVLQISELALGAHPTFIQRVMEAVFMGVKWLIYKGDHSPPSRVEVKVRGAVTPLPHMLLWCAHRFIFMLYLTCCLLSVYFIQGTHLKAELK